MNSAASLIPHFTAQCANGDDTFALLRQFGSRVSKIKGANVDMIQQKTLSNNVHLKCIIDKHTEKGLRSIGLEST